MTVILFVYVVSDNIGHRFGKGHFLICFSFIIIVAQCGNPPSQQHNYSTSPLLKRM